MRFAVNGRIMSEDGDGGFLIERRPYSPSEPFSLLGEIYVEKGTREDWEEFHALHYKAEVLGVYPRFYRIGLHGEPIGCVVFTVPRITLAGRNTLLKHIAPNRDGLDTTIMNKYRAKWLNRNTATLSRMVLDTMYRGVGIAYRAQNIAMRMTGLAMLEFQSSMSRVNPFAQKAGIVFTKPRRNAAYAKGVKLFQRWFRSVPTDYVGIFEEYKSLPAPVQKKCLEELREFYYQYSCIEKSGDKRLKKRGRVIEMETGVLIKSLQQLVFAFPMYGAYMNPDVGRILPPRIPISVFDRVSVSEPLDDEVLALEIARLEAKTL